MVKIDIVVPCYNESEVLSIFFDEISKSLKNYDWEVIFVDDGSTDDTLNMIKSLASSHSNVKFLSFSRNFGKESAIYAGFTFSRGDYVVLMDADLQDPPSLIPEMLNEVKEGGYDVCATRRVTRKGEPILRSFGARSFYKLINKFGNIDIVDGARDFRLMKKEVVDAILEMKEVNRFSKGIFQWVGFEIKWLEYENIEREEGESSWSLFELFKYSIEGLVSFSNIPLHLSTIFGIIFSFLSFIAIIYIIIKTILYGNPVDGWPSIVTIILFISGIQLFSIGILGQYLSRVFLEIKNRPIYILKENNFK